MNQINCVTMTLEEFNHHLQMVTSKRDPTHYFENMTEDERKDYGIWVSHRMADICDKEQLLKNIGTSFAKLIDSYEDCSCVEIGRNFNTLMLKLKNYQSIESRFVV